MASDASQHLTNEMCRGAVVAAERALTDLVLTVVFDFANEVIANKCIATEQGDIDKVVAIVHAVTAKYVARSPDQLARPETAIASIPQQVAAVASLPTQCGAHTFEEAAIPVWSKKLMQEAMNMLSAADPFLAPLIHEHGASRTLLPTATDSTFHALAHVIMGQKLSVRAAKSIAQKVRDACGGHEHLQAAAVLQLPGPELLACGLSRQKLACISDLAQRFHNRTLETKSFMGAF